MKRKNTIKNSLLKKGKELDLNEMKKQVQELHHSEDKKDATPTVRKVRLSVDTPEEVYLSLKSKVLRDKTTIKKYVLALIKDDLGF